MVPFLVDIRDVSTNVKWGAIDGVSEYLLIYESIRNASLVSSFFADGNIVHLHNSLTEVNISKGVKVLLVNMSR